MARVEQNAMKQCPICLSEYPDTMTNCSRDAAPLVENRDWPPGTMVKNKYRIVAQVGRGGMATVYRAIHLALEELRAIKVMDAHLARDVRFLQRFRQEAQMSRKLRQINVVQVDDLDQAEDGRPFIAMEFIEGLSLRQLLTSVGGPLPLARAIAITRGVAEALQAAHALGMVHRDIKPDNILLSRDARGADIPKVLDFGLVAMRESSATLSSQLLLTPAYGSPEQWEGKRSSELDGRADLYSLGMTLYEMLAGRLPFDATTVDAWMRAHLRQAPEPPSRYNPALAGMGGVDAVVLKLLAKDREQRTRTAQELLNDLNLLETQYSWGKETVVVRNPEPLLPPKPQPPEIPIPRRVEPPARPEPAPRLNPPAQQIPQASPDPAPIRVFREPGNWPSPQPARAEPPLQPAHPAIAPLRAEDPAIPAGGGAGEGEEPRIKVPEWRGEQQKRPGSGSKAWLWLVGGVVLLLAGLGLWQMMKPQPPEIESFEAVPSSIKVGEQSKLRWRVLNADTVSVEPGLGNFTARKDGASDGSVTVAPTEDITYKLVANGKNSKVESSVTLKVTRPVPVVRPGVIYSDDLRTVQNWPVNPAPPCPSGYGQGGLTIENVNAEFCGLRLTQPNIFGSLDDSVRIEISVRRLKGAPAGAYGLVFAAPQNFPSLDHVFYSFMVTGVGSYQLFRYSNGWYKLLNPDDKSWPQDEVIRQGQDVINRLAVEVRGDTIAYYINGRYLGRYTASDPLRGFSGLVVTQKGDGIVFSDLVITRLN